MRFIATKFVSFRILKVGLFTATAYAVSIGLSPSAQAQSVLFSSGVADNVNGAKSDSAGPMYQANNFTMDGQSIIDSVDWYGVYYNTAGIGSSVAPTTDNFTVGLYNTTGGTPDSSPIATFAVGNTAVRTTTGQNTLGLPDYMYSYTLAIPLALGPGTYSLGVNDATTAGSEWYWADSSETGGSDYQRASPTGSFTEQTPALAMGITGTTSASSAPEPGSLLLLAPMFTAGTAGFMRRCQRC